MNPRFLRTAPRFTRRDITDTVREDITDIPWQIQEYMYQISPEDSERLTDSDVNEIIDQIDLSGKFLDKIKDRFGLEKGEEIVGKLQDYIEIYIREMLKPCPDSAEKMRRAVIETYAVIKDCLQPAYDVDVLFAFHRNIDNSFRRLLEDRGIAILKKNNEYDFRMADFLTRHPDVKEHALRSALAHYQAAYKTLRILQHQALVASKNLDSTKVELAAAANLEASLVAQGGRASSVKSLALTELISAANRNVKEAVLKEEGIDLFADDTARRR